MDQLFDRTDSGGPTMDMAELEPEDIRHALYSSREFFIEYYLAEEIEDEVPDIHIIVAEEMWRPGQDKPFVAALPRGHAKSTIAKLGCPFRIYYTETRFIVYTSNTHGLAANALSDVWDMLNSAENIAAHGFPKPTVERIADGFYRFNVTAYRMNEETGEFDPYEKHVIMRAQGAGQQVRGLNVDNRRPDFAIVDDLESEENVATVAGYQKLKRWFYNTFRKAMAKEYDLVVIGNLVATQTVLNDLIKSKYWRSMRIGAIKSDGSSLWPWRWPLKALLADMHEYIEEGQLSTWFGEMMNMPVNVETGLVDPDRLKYTDIRTPELVEEEGNFAFITVDPAISQQAWADEAAVVLHTVVGGVPQITEYVHAKGLGEEGMAKAIIELGQRWKVDYVGVESVALQQVLLSYFDLYCQLRGIVFKFVPVLGSRTSKTSRLKIWGAMLMSGEYTLARSDVDVVNQLLGFDTSKTNNLDDLIDGCSMGSEMIRDYQHEMIAVTVNEQTPTEKPSQECTEM